MTRNMEITQKCPVCGGECEIAELRQKGLGKMEKEFYICDECGYKGMNEIDEYEINSNDDWQEKLQMNALEEYISVYEGEVVSECSCGKEIIAISDEISINKRLEATLRTICVCGKRHIVVLEEI